jgi:DNA-binding Lrp family transcriptional regulator
VDKTDIKLLRQIEIDGRQSFAKLGERVGLSKTPCWQRVQKLETLVPLAETPLTLVTELLWYR